MSNVNVGQTLITVSQVAGIQYRMYATTQDENDQGIHSMRLIVNLGRAEYPTLEVDFNLVIAQATCNCNLIVWDEPAILSMDTKLYDSPVQTETLIRASINADSEQAEPAIRSCTGAAACDRTSTIVLVDKDTQVLDTAFMTFDDSTMLLTVQPTISSQIGTYTLEMTQTVQTGHAPIVMDVITITVDCIIEEILTPTTPATINYNLMSNIHYEDIAPNFTQWPPCDYPIVENIVWTIPEITDDTDAIQAVSDYQISVQSN